VGIDGNRVDTSRTKPKCLGSWYTGQIAWRSDLTPIASQMNVLDQVSPDILMDPLFFSIRNASNDCVSRISY